MKSVADTNLLLAAVSPIHPFHMPARARLNKLKPHGWGISVETFLSTVRLLMNRDVMENYPLSAADALAVVRRELGGSHPGKIITGVAPSDEFLKKAQGHRQVMDFYLVNVAAANNAKLVTMDARLCAEWPQDTELVS